MEFEFWWLVVLPLFFVLGWVASRLEARQIIRASSRLPDAYFTGLNFLLKEQPDKAIDAFVDVVKLDPETVELHFALASLFRRRGETDRAIRVHQNLIGRSDLAPERREQALLELGEDYLKAGLLDRAEQAFEALARTPLAPTALRHRLTVAQMVRDWPLAVSLAERLSRETGTDTSGWLVHFHCERAEEAIRDPEGAAAAALSGAARTGSIETEIAAELDAAIAADPLHPRPWLLRGERAFAAGKARAALQAWNQVRVIAPAHLGLIGARWLKAHAELGELDAGLQVLEAVYREGGSVDALRAIAHARLERDGLASALAWLQAELASQPSLLGLEQLLELQRLAAPSDIPLSDVQLTATLIRRQAARLSRFVCGHCGFKARQFHWQCPGCSQWDRYAPKRTEELEAG